MHKLTILLCLSIISTSFVLAQGDGPRSHLLTPTGVWAINAKYLNLDQNLLPAGNILVEDLDLKINLFHGCPFWTF